MSDTWIRLIPTEHDYIPTCEAQTQGLKMLRSFAPDADDVEANAFDDIQFVDCGGNWMGVTCPHCGANAEPWFADALARALDANRFRDLSVVVPCCGASCFLDKLDFGWPVGFARFVLEARNPGLPAEGLTPLQHLTLEETLGCSLQVIWRHL